jgi:hypothetical protein
MPLIQMANGQRLVTLPIDTDVVSRFGGMLFTVPSYSTMAFLVLDVILTVQPANGKEEPEWIVQSFFQSLRPQ